MLETFPERQRAAFRPLALVNAYWVSNGIEHAKVKWLDGVNPPARMVRLPTVLLVTLLGLWSVCASSNQMVIIPGGVYRPLFRSGGEAGLVKVRAFQLDVFPVSTADFLEFVRVCPEWRRSQVNRPLADESYLRDWAGDLNPGPLAASNAPVTFVSWYAAKAFALWKGRRLPTTAEWELAAAASADRADGGNDAAFMKQVLDWYVTPAPDAIGEVGRGRPNYFGVHDLHGLVWEWVGDAVVSTNTDSRARSNVPGEAFCGGGAQGARDTRDYPAFMRTSLRSSLQPSFCVHNLGFRCARDLTETPRL